MRLQDLTSVMCGATFAEVAAISV